MNAQEEYQWMRRAVDLAKASVEEADRSDKSPAVGAVVVKDGVEIAHGFRGQLGEGNHAEYCALKELPDGAARGATVYTTLEPCTKRNDPKIACARRLIDSGVSTVVIGLYDPNPVVYREGWRLLRNAGIELRDFAPDLRNELRHMNVDFIEKFRASAADFGARTFDYILNGAYTLGTGASALHTRWSEAGSGSIWGIADRGCIAEARHAKRFDEIDDAAALTFEPDAYTIGASEGEILVFRSGDRLTYALVRVDRVLLQSAGDDRNELAFAYEIRRASAQIRDGSA